MDDLQRIRGRAAAKPTAWICCQAARAISGYGEAEPHFFSGRLPEGLEGREGWRGSSLGLGCALLVKYSWRKITKFRQPRGLSCSRAVAYCCAYCTILNGCKARSNSLKGWRSLTASVPLLYRSSVVPGRQNCIICGSAAPGDPPVRRSARRPHTNRPNPGGGAQFKAVRGP